MLRWSYESLRYLMDSSKDLFLYEFDQIANENAENVGAKIAKISLS